MENCVWIRVIGKGGLEKGTVIDEAVTFTELDKLQYPESKVMAMISTMRDELEEHESKYSDEVKKQLGI